MVGAELGTDEETARATARSFTMFLDLDDNDLLLEEPMSLTRKSLTGRKPKTVERKSRHDNRRKHPADMVREEALAVGGYGREALWLLVGGEALVVGDLAVGSWQLEVGRLDMLVARNQIAGLELTITT